MRWPIEPFYHIIVLDSTPSMISLAKPIPLCRITRSVEFHARFILIDHLWQRNKCDDPISYPQLNNEKFAPKNYTVLDIFHWDSVMWRFIIYKNLWILIWQGPIYFLIFAAGFNSAIVDKRRHKENLRANFQAFGYI